MDWLRTSHASWDCADMRIVQIFCPRQGGRVFKLFNGRTVSYHKTLDEAQSAAKVQQ